jgi:hypothetical protein
VRKPKDTDRYYITYRIEHHPEGLTREQVMELSKDGELGATHDLAFFSMMHTEDGGLSVLEVGRSHDGTELQPLEIFKALVVFMPGLAEQLPKDSWQRGLAETFVDAVRMIMRKR